MKITAIAPTTVQPLFASCSQSQRTFSDEWLARNTAKDAARMNIVKLDDFWYDASSHTGYARFCGDPDLVNAAVRTYQTW